MNCLLLFVLLGCGAGTLAGTPWCRRHQHAGGAVGCRTCTLVIDQNHRLIPFDFHGRCHGADFDGVNVASNAVHVVENAWRYADERI